MATYAVETSVKTGLTPTSNAVASSDDFANTGKIVVRVTNGSGSLLTITITSTAVIDTDLAVADRTITVANGATKFIGPFSTSTYSTTCTLAYDQTTSVVAEVITF